MLGDRQQATGSSYRPLTDYQKTRYADKNGRVGWLNDFSFALDNYKGKSDINILDVGGGTGLFANNVWNYFDKSANVYCLEITEYDTWKNTEGVNFIKGSAENLETIFGDIKFDVIFMNNVVHHFVKDTYSDTVKCQRNILESANHLLTENGILCINDEPVDSYLCVFSNWLIYQLTTISNSHISTLIRKLGAKAAGVGVHFLSLSEWVVTLCELNFTPMILNPGKGKRKWYMHLFLLLKEDRFGFQVVCKKKV